MLPKQHNFALMGAAGYIAHRHLKALRETELSVNVWNSMLISFSIVLQNA